MKSLFKTLPPFSPDYSGVCSALFELGGLLVLMDASGCTGNYTGYDEPRWFGSASKVFCSGLREMDAVLGDEEKLFRKVEHSVAESRCNFIAILGSPVPMVIGTDYKAVALELSQRLGIPALSFDTSGMRWYDAGASGAFLEIAKLLVKPAQAKIKKSVNILGATPLDMGSASNMDSLKRILAEAGYRVLSCWSMGAGPEQISAAAAAEANIVVSGSGLQAARHMRQEYGIPFIAGIPVGSRGTEQFLCRLRAVMTPERPREESGPEISGKGNRASILLLGEQVMCNSMRDCLRLDFGFANIDVASYFNMDGGLMEPGDRKLEHEGQLTELTREIRYAAVIGDPLYKPLVAGSEELVFAAFPHIAVSSKLYWDQPCDYVGEAGRSLISQWL